ncbi:OmpH family outer membrane protein [Spirosoma sp. HMF3257]|uniref:OmpH family outer membrane protein n=1 Tax=Spirosoma telluris TaxID=2183553 RepID=A0A327NJP7_9BACT|nr:OmpH family outer membrane protein [Spirosoma telluris]RAI75005.1 OmpH family outer membrane protein [Spirosoma telluris]
MKKIFSYVLFGVLSLTWLGLQAQSVKIGHTRIDYILSQTPENKVITDLLTVQQNKAQAELKRLQQELQEKYALYQKGAAQMTDIIRKDRETELQTLQSRIQVFSRDADESLQSKYKQLVSPTLTKIQQAIDSVAKENGYTHILNTGNGNDILYAPEENNITELVLKKMGITPGQVSEKPVATAPAAPKPTVKKTVPKKK